MRPYADIHVMDVYKAITGAEFVVVNKNDQEKMVEVLMLSNLPPALNRSFWKKNTDKLFRHRVQIGY